jgi:hypothetical protein
MAAVGCGEELVDLNGDGRGDAPGEVTQIALVHPTAAISGYVYSAVSDLPLEGVVISLRTGHGALSANTGADGFFELAGVPAGGVALVGISKDGFLSARVGVETPDDAGNFPSSAGHATIGSIGLLPTASLSTTIYNDNLLGAAALRVGIHFPFRYFVDGTPKGDVTVVTDSGDDGALRFDGAPDLAAASASLSYLPGVATVQIGAGDGSEGDQLSLTWSRLCSLGGLPALVRNGEGLEEAGRAGRDLRLVHSNISDLIRRRQAPKVIVGTEPVRLLFDQVVDLASLFISLNNEDGSGSVNLETEIGAAGRMITLRGLGNPPLSAGAEYNLQISASSADGLGQAWAGSANIFTAAASGAPFSEDDHPVTWEDRNDDGEINGGDYLFLSAILPIGRRSANGSSNISSGLAEYAFDAPLSIEESVLGEQDYAPNGIVIYPQMNLIEPNSGNGTPASGFTTQLRLRLPSAAAFSAGMGISVRVWLIFDNPNRLNANNQVRSSLGAALSRYPVRLALP